MVEAVRRQPEPVHDAHGYCIDPAGTSQGVASMNPPVIVLRLVACVLCNAAALALLAFMYYVHNDTPAGVAMACGMVFISAIVAPGKTQ